MLPPDADRRWVDCDMWTKAQLLAYEDLRQHEEFSDLEMLIKAGAVKKPVG